MLAGSNEPPAKALSDKKSRLFFRRLFLFCGCADPRGLGQLALNNLRSHARRSVGRPRSGERRYDGGYRIYGELPGVDDLPDVGYLISATRIGLRCLSDSTTAASTRWTL